MRMLANVQQKTIQPVIEAAVAKGARIHTEPPRVRRRLVSLSQAASAISCWAA